MEIIIPRFEEKQKQKTVDLDMAKALCVPYHPRARKLYRIFKKEFGIDTIFKKTQTLGDIILKTDRKRVQKEYSLQHTMRRMPKKIRRPNNCNIEQKK